jgi:protein-tyrosine phosphatase
MTSILVVCTGNICRSPIAEGLLRGALSVRFGRAAPAVSSAGTAGLEGRSAQPESVQAAAERGADIAGHRAREITPELAADADLMVAMSTEHRDAIVRLQPSAAGRAFTLKELVRVLEELDEPEPGVGPDFLPARVGEADDLRSSGFDGNPHDQDVVDPLGMPLESYRAIAWELDGWTSRLVTGLWGEIRVRAPADAGGDARESGS